MHSSMCLICGSAAKITLFASDVEKSMEGLFQQPDRFHRPVPCRCRLASDQETWHAGNFSETVILGHSWRPSRVDALRSCCAAREARERGEHIALHPEHARGNQRTSWQQLRRLDTTSCPQPLLVAAEPACDGDWEQSPGIVPESDYSPRVESPVVDGQGFGRSGRPSVAHGLPPRPSAPSIPSVRDRSPCWPPRTRSAIGPSIETLHRS